MELTPTLVVLVMLVSFLGEYIDSSLGMGYGTTLTPILLLLGFEPLQVVPAVLASEFVTGLAAAAFHHGYGNVQLRRGSRDLNLALVLGGIGLLGAVVAALVAVRLPPRLLGHYIGIVVFVTGVILLVAPRGLHRFSWGRLVGAGLVAGFNKSIGGGGYGPLITTGQMLAGVEPGAAIGVASLAEGVVSLASVLTYVAVRGMPDWRLPLMLLTGAVLSTPLAALTVRRLRIPHLRAGVGIAACVLGVLTFAQYSAG
jgi:uncharacterized protein